MQSGKMDVFFATRHFFVAVNVMGWRGILEKELRIVHKTVAQQ